MSRWFTADTHFGHARICEFEPEARGQFASVEEMNEQIIENFNSVLQPDDELWILGDVALGKLDDSLECISRLNGKKALVAGNHDRCWLGYGKNQQNPRKLVASTQRYKDAGFEEVIIDQTAIFIGDTFSILSHFPYVGDSHTEEDRFREWRPTDKGGWIIHGHVHSSFTQRGRQINVGVDVRDLMPVHEDEIVEIISRGPRDI